jgi:predicted dehydrogenase
LFLQSLALLKGISVYLGYNKNVTPYVQKALDLANRIEHAHIFFCHNNSYTEEDLPEVFARNSEGMMKNMAVHELALLVTYFGVTVNTIQEFKVNKSRLFSEKLRIRIPDSPNTNPQYISDFSRIAFKITTKAGKTVSVMADRCGGNVSYAIVKDETGKEVNKFEFPDPKFAAKVEQLSNADPEMMPYFFVQSDDYLELKRRIVNSYLKGINAPGIATIDVAIEALKLAEYGTEAINKALESS